jgi:hypothetical protein
MVFAPEWEEQAPVQLASKSILPAPVLLGPERKGSSHAGPECPARQMGMLERPPAGCWAAQDPAPGERGESVVGIAQARKPGRTMAEAILAEV